MKWRQEIWSLEKENNTQIQVKKQRIEVRKETLRCPYTNNIINFYYSHKNNIR